MSVCDKHKSSPARIYAQCVGCEIDNLQAEKKRLQAIVDQLLHEAQGNGFIGDSLDDAIAWAVRQMGEAMRSRNELDRLQAIVDRLVQTGNAMPRKTLFHGGSGDEFQYTISSGAVWDFDKAMQAAEKSRTQ